MKTVPSVIFVCSFLLVSCSATEFFSRDGGNFCACDDDSGKYGPKGEKCGEILKEKIGKQGYYGELEISKSPAYYSKECRSRP